MSIILLNKKPDDVGRRSLRILHVGNIANNGYYNAKFLRKAGVDADVLCYDNYWTMSSPEWEELDFDGVPADQIFPNWRALGIKGYEHPRWFAQGPFDLCVAYLLAKQMGRTAETERLWKLLVKTRRLICSPSYSGLFSVIRELKKYFVKSPRLENQIRSLSNAAVCVISGIAGKRNTFHERYLNQCRTLIEEFELRFPDRPDRLTMEDMAPYENKTMALAELFEHYDIVQGYAVDPIYPMLAGFRPYVAFEHGTLRDSPEVGWAYKGPFFNSALSRLTALSYAIADHVFVTNADCLASAKRLGISNFEAVPHPLDEDSFSPDGKYWDSIRERFKSEFIFFCPIRHDWDEKGVDQYIRAIPKLRGILGNKFKVCFTPWGKEVDRSRRLISELDCDDLTEWVGPFGRVRFVRWMSASDIVFDQLAYPSFSGITPRALSCGVPVVAAYESDIMRFMFSEPAPVLAAQSPDDIVEQVLRAIRPGFRKDYGAKARAWIERYHSSETMLTHMLGAYDEITQRVEVK